MVDLLERVRRFIRRMEIAIQGQNGSTALFKVGLVCVQGFGLDEETSVQLILSEYNPLCVPPWTEAEIRHKIADAAKASTGKPKGYLLGEQNYVPRPETRTGADRPKSRTYVRDQQPPTDQESQEIGTNLQVFTPGVFVAGLLGTLRVGELFGQRVWGIGDAGGPTAAVRRIDGQPFEAYGNGTLPERKTHCLVSGVEFHRAYGFIPGVQGKGIALGEGLSDYLALMGQAVVESNIDFMKMRDREHVVANIGNLPLCMLSATARLEGSSLKRLKGAVVRIFHDNDETGKKARDVWARSLSGLANRVDAFDCGAWSDKPGADFSDVYQTNLNERVMPV